jgi:hypothetical protein
MRLMVFTEAIKDRERSILFSRIGKWNSDAKVDQQEVRTKKGISIDMPFLFGNLIAARLHKKLMPLCLYI